MAVEPAASNGHAEIILDLSRLVSRLLHPTPTGIDRVEMAYARELIRTIPDRLSFAAVHPTGIYGRLPAKAVHRFLDETERMWDGAQTLSSFEQRLYALKKMVQLRPRFSPPQRSGRPRIYLQASPHHLGRPRLVKQILARENARFICLVHDLIPIEFPEYARPGGADQHKVRMDTLGLYADALITNSAATQRAMASYLAPSGRVPPITVAHLGTHVGTGHGAQNPVNGPYFVCVGTIEPRKNHLLLLNIWRRLVEESSPADTIPKLVLIGRRGWENENVVDMLDRCPALQGHVIEARRMRDRDVDGIIRGARALLLPSFAEGYGMPVAEALAMGVPVICSDLPALREVGADAAVYLDPVDGHGWMAAIRDYSTEASANRRESLQRTTEWRMPTWQDHLRTVIDLCDQTASA